MAGLAPVARVDVLLRDLGRYPAGGDDSPRAPLLGGDGGVPGHDLVVPVPGDGHPRAAGVRPAPEDGLAVLDWALRLHLYLHGPRGEADRQLDALDDRLGCGFVPGGAVISFSIVGPISSN